MSLFCAEGDSAEEVIKAYLAVIAIHFGYGGFQDRIPDSKVRLNASLQVSYELLRIS